MKPGTAPMKRNAMARKPADATGVLRVQSFDREKKARRPMKATRPKMTPIRKAARNQDCTLRIAGVCNGDTTTTVWAHSNRAEDGKGMGIKARDEEGCFACSACHTFLDGGYAGKVPRAVVDRYFDLARAESQVILKMKGLMSE